MSMTGGLRGACPPGVQGLYVGAGLVPARVGAAELRQPLSQGALFLPRVQGRKKAPGIRRLATPAGPRPGGDKPRPYFRSFVIYRIYEMPKKEVR